MKNVMLHVIDRLSDGFAATPRDVFASRFFTCTDCSRPDPDSSGRSPRTWIPIGSRDRLPG